MNLLDQYRRRPAARCNVCGNPIFWEDPYHGLHCGDCDPAPSAALLVRALIAARRDDGSGWIWEDVTDRMRREWLTVPNDTEDADE